MRNTTRFIRLESARRSAGRPGFTLIEILIVVVILGILAAIVIPQFSDATYEARQNTLKDALRYLRTQITIFKAQHRDIAPGYPGGNLSSTPDSADFLSQMTLYSDEVCNTSSTPSSVFTFGPYLSQMPNDPMTTQSGVLVVTGTTMPAPDESQPYGWIYNPQTLQIIPNLQGSDPQGVPFISY